MVALGIATAYSYRQQKKYDFKEYDQRKTHGPVEYGETAASMRPRNFDRVTEFDGDAPQRTLNPRETQYNQDFALARTRNTRPFDTHLPAGHYTDRIFRHPGVPDLHGEGTEIMRPASTYFDSSLHPRYDGIESASTFINAHNDRLSSIPRTMWHQTQYWAAGKHVRQDSNVLKYQVEPPIAENVYNDPHGNACQVWWPWRKGADFSVYTNRSFGKEKKKLSIQKQKDYRAETLRKRY